MASRTASKRVTASAFSRSASTMASAAVLSRACESHPTTPRKESPRRQVRNSNRGAGEPGRGIHNRSRRRGLRSLPPPRATSSGDGRRAPCQATANLRYGRLVRPLIRHGTEIRENFDPAARPTVALAPPDTPAPCRPNRGTNMTTAHDTETAQPRRGAAAGADAAPAGHPLPAPPPGPGGGLRLRRRVVRAAGAVLGDPAATARSNSGLVSIGAVRWVV